MKIINEEEMSLSKHESRDDEKKSYSEPTLKEIGGVQELTKSYAIGDGDDGAGYNAPSL